jgi:uncharacterized RDD family membrane protein YckC
MSFDEVGDKQVATVWERLIARIVDVIVILAISIPFVPVVKEYGLHEHLPGLLGIVYLLLADGLRNGQSVGKRIVGIQVVTSKNMVPCGVVRSIIRNVFLVDFVFVIGAAIDWIILDGANRRVGDYVAGTCVVRLSKQAL